MTEDYRAYGDRLEPYIADTPPIAWHALDDGRLVLFEGAQGTLLDIDHGTYPFVTSSNPVAGRRLRRARASGPTRSTRSGGSRRPTPPASARGRSPPSSTTRSASASARRAASSAPPPAAPRRCGWLDLVALRYAVRVNGLTGLVLTKLDVLSGIDPLQVGVRYRGREGASFDDFPYHQSVLHRAHGDYEELPGWHEDISGCRTLDDLPANAPPTSTSSRTSWASRSCWWASAPAATR